MAKTREPMPVEELPRLPNSEEHRVAVSEERLAEEGLQDRTRAQLLKEAHRGRTA